MLLAYLALKCGEAVSRDKLIDTVWPDASFSAGRNSLNVALSNLRRTFGSSDDPAEPVFGVEGANIRLNPRRVTTDLSEFQSAIESAKKCRVPHERKDHLRRAVDLYGGDFLPAEYADWVLATREELLDAYRGVLRELVTAEQKAENPDQAARDARRLVDADPSDQSAHHLLIDLLLAQEDFAAAKRRLQELDAILERHRLPPSSATQALRQQFEEAVAKAAAADAASTGGTVRERSAPVPEHRSVAILCAGRKRAVVPARSHASDAESTRDRRFRRRMEEIVERHGGVVEGSMADRILAVFGEGKGREDDSVRALHAAKEIVALAAEMEIAASAAAEEGIAYVERGALSGAAIVPEAELAFVERLCESAQDGEILVGSAVQATASRAFAFERISPPSAKDAVHRVLDPRPAGVRVRAPDGIRPELVGRAEEMERRLEIGPGAHGADHGRSRHRQIPTHRRVPCEVRACLS